MAKRLAGLHPLAYMGVNPSTPPQMIHKTHAPTANNDENVNIGAIWVVTDTDDIYVLTSLAGGVATWTPMSGLTIAGGTGITVTTVGNTSTLSVGGGTDGQVLIGATGTDAVWANLESSSGTISIANTPGGINLEATGVAGLSTGVLVADAGGVISSINGTDGQVIIGATGTDPVFVTIASADSSIEITGGAGTLDLSASGIISINAETGTTYEFVLSDVGKLVTCTNASAITVTVPVNADVAIPIGSQILVTQLGAGVVTLSPEGGVTLNSRGSLLDTNGQYATVACIKRDTDVWLISGDLA